MDEVKCSNPSCRFSVVMKSTDGFWRFTTRALKTLGKGNPLIAVCRSCKTETTLPLSVTDEFFSKGSAEKQPAPKPKGRRGFTVIKSSSGGIDTEKDT